jgi:hypothetical protein
VGRIEHSTQNSRFVLRARFNHGNQTVRHGHSQRVIQ